MKKAYTATRTSVNNGITKIKDPEFQQGVKEKVSNGFQTMKSGTENVINNVSERFVETPYQRPGYTNVQEKEDSPFDVLSDEESSSDDENGLIADQKQTKTNGNKVNNGGQTEGREKKAECLMEDDEDSEDEPIIQHSEVAKVKISQQHIEDLEKLY